MMCLAKGAEGWKVFPITFPQNTCRSIYGKVPGEHGRTPRTRPSQAPHRCHSLLPTTTSLHPSSAAQPGLLCLEKTHPKQKKKTIKVFKRHQQSSPRSNTGGTQRSQQVPRLLALFFYPSSQCRAFHEHLYRLGFLCYYFFPTNECCFLPFGLLGNDACAACRLRSQGAGRGRECLGFSLSFQLLVFERPRLGRGKLTPSSGSPALIVISSRGVWCEISFSARAAR